jgi:hypothetical protein
MDEKTASSADIEKPEKKGAQCPYCQRTFVSQDELTLHIVTRHTHKSKTGSLAQTGVKR